jgi:protein-tyrosine phosphatase
MIDLHSHLLPGIDDGAPSLDVTIAMLDAFVSLGFTTVAATPHLDTPRTDAYAARVAAERSRIAPLAAERGLSVVHGFEIRLAPDTPALLRSGAPVTLGATNTVLVDLPFTEWPLYADDTLFALQAAGHRVLLAHPERYPGLQADPDRAASLVDRGILLQLTTGSLAGAFGKRARASAETLLERGLIHLVATDAHSAGHRLAAVPAGLDRLRELLGDDDARQLTTDAPAALLAGDPLPPPPSSRKRRWALRIPAFRR